MHLLYCFALFFCLTGAITGNSGVTFRNVNMYIYDIGVSSTPTVTTIHSGNSLGEYLPKTGDYNWVRIEDQHIPVLYDYSISGVNLETLDIADCELREIQPRAFWQAQLWNLHLGRNKLEEIRHGVFSNSTFEEIILSGNKISIIQPGAFENTYISTLNLMRNKLKEVTEQYFADSSIISLYLSYNRINRIAPKAFERVAKLSVLFLDNNELENIDGAFIGLRDVRKINLNNNKIVRLDPGVFRNTFANTGDSELSLANNKIGTIKKGVFNNLTLSNLYLFSNEITSVEEGAFDNMPNVQRIDLSFNKHLRNARGCFQILKDKDKEQ